MLCIDSQTGNPFYNLAMEEYLLKQMNDEYFILWESQPSVIVGKHQNAFSEINYRYVKENGILVCRRLSGGGTVFHDRGNLNYTFIRNGKPGQLVNFTLFIEPVLKFLFTLDINAVQGPKHEILVNGKKISGNAEHVYKQRVLHHGTLLFNADLQSLQKSIIRNSGRYSDRAVQSNRAEVTNISDCLPQRISLNDFRHQLYEYIREYLNGKNYNPDDNARISVMKMADEKYSNKDWIFGWSPDYVYSNEWTREEISVRIQLEVHRGVITQSSVISPQLNAGKLNSFLKGKPHSEDIIREALRLSEIENTAGDLFEELVFAFF